MSEPCRANDRASQILNCPAGDAALVLGLIALFACSAARAQQVVSAAAGTAVLSVGSDAGVVKGLTGKFCASEIVGGQPVQNCSARFVIVSVTADQSV